MIAVTVKKPTSRTYGSGPGVDCRERPFQMKLLSFASGRTSPLRSINTTSSTSTASISGKRFRVRRQRPAISIPRPRPSSAAIRMKLLK